MNKNLRISLLFLSIIATALAIWKMYSLPLWSWWIMLFLVGLWATWLMGAHRLYINSEKGWRWLGLSTLSGVLLAAGFPVSSLTPLMFVSWIPLLMVLDEIGASDIAKPKRMMMRYTYNALVWWNILATFWVGNAGLAAGMIANFLNSFFMCLPILGYFILKKRHFFPFFNKKIEEAAIFIAFWFSWEYLHLHWDLSWTWLTLGNAFAQKTDWVQWYEYTGVFGGGLWILSLNFLFYHCFKNYNFDKKTGENIFLKKNKKLIISTLSILIVPFFISFFIKNKEKKQLLTEVKTAKVVALQPNYEPHYEKFTVPDEQQLDRILKLIKKSVDNETDYLVMPETTFGYYDIDHLLSYTPASAFQMIADSFPNLHIVTGFDLFRLYPLNVKDLPPSVRQRSNRNMEIYNAATQFCHGQKDFPLYKKSKLVPGPEVLPFRWALKWLEPIFKKMGGTVEGLGTQPERSVFWNKNSIAIAPVICYESIYGEYCGDYVRHGAKALFVMTNDGWWDDTPGYKQHNAFSRLRAVELRRPVVRAANTGSSSFINSLGEVEQASEYGIATSVTGQIQYGERLTFYAKYGDFLAKISALMATIFIILSLRKKYE